MSYCLPVQTKPHYIKSGPVPILRDWRSLPAKELTRGELVCRFIEKCLVIPEGDKVGQNIVLEVEQQMFFLAIYDNPAVTDTAIKSVARKNAKTAEAAMLVLAHTVGPEAIENSRIISGAMSRDQASEVYNYASKMAMMSEKIRDHVKIVPSKKQIFGTMMNVEYIATSADAKTAHGKSPVLAILDEMGQITGPQSDYVDAITTAQGAYAKPILIYISTQAPTDADFFSVQIDDAVLNQPPKTVCHVFAAPDECDIMDEGAWRMANPALGKYRSIADVRKQAEKASRLPSFEATFRNLILNQRVSMESPFVSRSVWEDNGGTPNSLKGQKVFAGLDLSAVSDLTGLVLVGEFGDVEVDAWLPKEGLREKAKEDRVPYDVWEKHGFLSTTPGRSIEYEYIAHKLRVVFNEYDVQQLNFDRYAMKFLRPWLEKAGFTEKELERFVDFGQGMVSMSPAIRALESSLLQKKLRHGNHPVLTMCIGNCRIEGDAAGNRKFTKKKSRGRIDLAVCLAMAEDARSREMEKPDKEYRVMFV